MSAPYRRRSGFDALGNAAPFFLAMWGWAAVAVALSARGPLVAIAAAGLVAAFTARRAPWPTGIVEAVAFSAAVAIAPATTSDFLFAGGVLAGAARVIAAVIRMRAGA